VDAKMLCHDIEAEHSEYQQDKRDGADKRE
jgi:hypothetical protein